MKPLGCECSDCPTCNGTVGRLKNRVSVLEAALSQLLSEAEECDGWESFPSAYLDAAQDALDT